MLVAKTLNRNKKVLVPKTMNQNQWTRNYSNPQSKGKSWDERERGFEDKDVRDHDTQLALDLAKKLEEARLVCNSALIFSANREIELCVYLQFHFNLLFEILHYSIYIYIYNYNQYNSFHPPSLIVLLEFFCLHDIDFFSLSLQCYFSRSFILFNSSGKREKGKEIRRRKCGCFKES